MSYREEQIRKAMGGYEKKHSPFRQKKKRGSPEKAVEFEVMKWLDANGFDCDVFEAKAVWSASAGRYVGGMAMVEGVSDVVGNDPLGNACYIELKAPGRRSTVRDPQRDYLGRKINSNSFAVVVDSVKLLQEYYTLWLKKKTNEFGSGVHRDYLRELMPQKSRPARG